MFRPSTSPIHIAFLFVVVLATRPANADVSGTVIDGSGSPIEGARVIALDEETPLERRERWLSEQKGPTPLAEAVTDSKGNYTLEVDDALTAVDLRFEASGHLPVSVRVPHDGWVGATLLPDERLIRGRVIGAGKPVAGATVIVDSPLQAEIRALTDEQGRFSIPNPPTPLTSVAVVHPEFAPLYEEGYSLSEGMTLRLVRGSPLSGNVVTPDGEQPGVGVLIMLDGWPVTVSDEDGRFSISHAPADWSEVKLAQGSLAAAVSRSTAKSTTVRLRRAATVTGTVTDSESGKGISGVVVGLGDDTPFGGRAMMSTITDSSGQFSVRGVLPGSYTLLATHPSWVAKTDRLTVTGSNNVDRRLELVRSSTVRGRTLDERGEPVGGALVEVQYDTSGGFRFSRAQLLAQSNEIHSSPGGRFVAFGVEPEKTLTLVGSHRAFPDTRSRQVELDPGEVESGTDLVFPRGVSISGTVIDAQGDPISGAEIRASESDRGGPRGPRMTMIRALRGTDQPTVTDAKGRFDVKVSEGVWDLSVSAAGFAPRSLKAIETGDDLEPLEIILEEGAVIQGRVVRNGIGLAEVMVSALSGAMREPVTTGSDGSFTIADLPRGSATIIAIKPDEAIQEMRTVEAPARDLLIEIPPGGSVRGRVVDEATKEPVTDFQAGASPEQSGGMVRIRTGRGLKSFHSEDGTFFLENVPVGRSQVIVQAPGYVQKSVRGITVAEGETVDGIEVELSRGVRVTGIVRGPDGRPLSGVSVRVLGNEDDPIAQMMPELLSDASTDSSGEYVIAALPEGETTLLFSRDDYVSTRKNATLEGEETRVDATLSSGRTVTGTVMTSSGAPISGASIRAFSSVQESQRNIAETDATGRFELEGLPEGRYTFLASHSDYVDTRLEDVDISGGQPVRLIMDQGGTIVGRVLGVEPSDYESITVYASGDSSAGGSRSSVSPDGTYRLEAVPPGNVSVRASMGRMFDSRSSRSETVEVTGGSQVSVDLHFDEGSTVTGRVTRDGEPIRSGFIRFGTRNSQAGGSSSIDSEGQYSISGLEPGTFDVIVTDLQTRTPHTEQVEVTSASQTIDIEIGGGGAIRGRVTDAATGQALEDVEIMIEPTDTDRRIPRRAITGASGEFVLEDLEEGSYRLQAERSGYGLETRDLFVSDGQAEAVQISLHASDGLTLRIVDLRDGRPLRGQVIVYDSQNEIIWEGSPTPREDGTGRIPLSTGTYLIRAAASGYAPSRAQVSTGGAAQVIALSPGGTLVIDSGASAPLQARIVDEWGMPHRSSRWNRAGDITLAPGTNRFDNLAPGRYTLQVRNESGTVSSEIVVIREGMTSTLSL